MSYQLLSYFKFQTLNDIYFSYLYYENNCF